MNKFTSVHFIFTFYYLTPDCDKGMNTGFNFMCRFMRPVSVAFVYKQQPIYNCTATENEFIVYYGIWCILNSNSLMALPSYLAVSQGQKE